MADKDLAGDRSIIRCSGTRKILAHFSAALIFLWLLSLHQGKESDNLEWQVGRHAGGLPITSGFAASGFPDLFLQR